MVRHVLTAETLWCNHFTTFLYQKLFSKTIKKYHHFYLADFSSLNHWPHLRSYEKVTGDLLGLSDAYYRPDLSIIVFEMLMIIWIDTLILEKIDPRWPLVTSSWAKIKNILSKIHPNISIFEQLRTSQQPFFLLQFFLISLLLGHKIPTSGFWEHIPHPTDLISSSSSTVAQPGGGHLGHAPHHAKGQ